MNNNELYHYGVLGMKWGIHRARKKEASKNRRKAYDKAEKELEKVYSFTEKQYKRGQTLSEKDRKRQEIAEQKYMDAVNKADRDYKMAKKDKSRDADIANRLYSKNSKEVNKKIANMSTGEAVARSFLLSSYGSLKWEQAKGAGYGTGKTFVTTWAKTGVNTMLGGVPGMLEYLDNVNARN